MTEDVFEWLLNWFSNECDGDWEHGHGIYINTINNPGWHVKIYIEETEFEDYEFERIDFERTKDNWVNCYVENKIFEAFGGPFNLLEIIQLFHDWTKKCHQES